MAMSKSDVSKYVISGWCGVAECYVNTVRQEGFSAGSEFIVSIYNSGCCKVLVVNTAILAATVAAGKGCKLALNASSSEDNDIATAVSRINSACNLANELTSTDDDLQIEDLIATNVQTHSKTEIEILIQTRRLKHHIKKVKQKDTRLSKTKGTKKTNKRKRRKLQNERNTLPLFKKDTPRSKRNNSILARE